MFDVYGKKINPFHIRSFRVDGGDRRVIYLEGIRIVKHPYKIRLYKKWYDKQNLLVRLFARSPERFASEYWKPATVEVWGADGVIRRIRFKSNQEAKEAKIILEDRLAKELEKYQKKFKKSEKNLDSQD